MPTARHAGKLPDVDAVSTADGAKVRQCTRRSRLNPRWTRQGGMGHDQPRRFAGGRVAACVHCGGLNHKLPGLLNTRYIATTSISTSNR